MAIIWSRRVVWLCALLGCAAAHADEIYRCKAYGGGTFWSREHCRERDALVDRIASVPGGMGFERQVKLAEQGARATERDVARASTLSRSEQQALQAQARAEARQQKKCQKLQTEQDLQDSRARQGLSARQRARWQNRQEKLQREWAAAAC
ncbi:MAG TPA: hypothetical protein VFY31_00035 [Macromonas sp.]|nr:hypothetical protein [Macromonas sp.]